MHGISIMERCDWVAARLFSDENTSIPVQRSEIDVLSTQALIQSVITLSACAYVSTIYHAELGLPN